MEDKLIRMGGNTGAVIAFSVALAVFIAMSIAQNRSSAFPGMIAVGLWFSIFPISLGYFAGLEGARSKSVRSAFIKGAIFFGCAVSVFILLLFYSSIRGEAPSNGLLVGISFAAIIISTASLISGMAAIVVRDYREFGRRRLFPQFTLQELMIVVTLTAIILSAIASMMALGTFRRGL
jgi:hypothetical protein